MGIESISSWNQYLAGKKTEDVIGRITTRIVSHGRDRLISFPQPEARPTTGAHAVAAEKAGQRARGRPAGRPLVRHSSCRRLSSIADNGTPHTADHTDGTLSRAVPSEWLQSLLGRIH